MGAVKMFKLHLGLVFGLCFYVDVDWKQIVIIVPFFEFVFDWDGEFGFQFRNLINSRG